MEWKKRFQKYKKYEKSKRVYTGLVKNKHTFTVDYEDNKLHFTLYPFFENEYIFKWTLKEGKIDYNLSWVILGPTYKFGCLKPKQNLKNDLQDLFEEIRENKKLYPFVGMEKSLFKFIDNSYTKKKFKFHYQTEKEGVIAFEHSFVSGNTKLKGYRYVKNSSDKIYFFYRLKERFIEKYGKASEKYFEDILKTLEI